VDRSFTGVLWPSKLSIGITTCERGCMSCTVT
jgi:hypothetical protein